MGAGRCCGASLSRLPADAAVEMAKRGYAYTDISDRLAFCDEIQARDR
jgi:hypothetical protein